MSVARIMDMSGLAARLHPGSWAPENDHENLEADGASSRQSTPEVVFCSDGAATIKGELRPGSSFFPVGVRQGDGWRLVSRGAVKPNIKGRRWKDRMLHRWQLKDWFYALVHMHTHRLLVFFAALYFFMVLFYAFVYYAVDWLGSCKLGLKQGFRAAFFFSLETHATIGYGAPSPTFNECYPMILALFTQAFLALVGDAVLIGVLFARMSRGTKRAASVVFSERAIIVEHKNEYFLLFQVFDKRRDALVEANIRVFCYIHHGVAGRRFPYNRAMKLAHPNQHEGGVLLMCSPTLVLHKLAPSSPLVAAASLAGYSAKEDGRLDPSRLVEALRSLAHFEIVVEVNGVENITTSQVQARWSFIAEEVSTQDNGGCWEMPDVTIDEGLAQVHRTAVAHWRTTDATHENSAVDLGTFGSASPLACALAFHVPEKDDSWDCTA
jgi:hypothetical protein